MKQTQLSYPTLAHAHSSTLQPTASFLTTFNGLATVAARLHTLRDGELVLYKRPHSRVWQCRFKLFANEWHRQTTKRTVLADAMRVAGELLRNSTDIHTLSKQMGNSAAMIERHYSKLTATMAADRLA